MPLTTKNIEHHLFANRYEYYGPFRQPVSANIIRYNSQTIETESLSPTARDVRGSIQNGFINWIRISGLADEDFISELLSELGFSSVDTKAIITPCRVSKFNQKTRRVLIVMRSCNLDDNEEIVTEHLAILARDNFVITFRELDEPLASHVVDAVRDNVLKVRDNNPLFLIALLLNNIFSQSLETALRIEDMLENLDDILLDATHNRLNVAKRIESCRHANLILQKNTVMLYEEFRDFIYLNFAHIDDETSLISDELVDQLQYIVLTSNNCKELLASMRDLYASNNELRMNRVMKRLTIVATLFIPITFLVGLWGMNFKYMPELAWKYSYPAALTLIGLTAFVTWRYMKRNGYF